jgi:hypothetical protein
MTRLRRQTLQRILVPRLSSYWSVYVTRASNQSVELTATRRTRTFIMTKTSLLRKPLAFGGGSSLLSR